MKQLATLLLALVAFASQAQTTCVDPLACNFTEPGDCIYVDENGDLCVVEGCNIEGACNYDPEADLNDGSCDFESCLGCTDETACNFDAEALYLDNSCIYYVDCNGTCGGDWIQDECGNCFGPVMEATPIQEFGSCGSSGRYGPSQAQCDSQYGSAVVQVNSGIQRFTIPETGDYRIEAAGARGGHSVHGFGAIVIAETWLEAGTELDILVGQKGGIYSDGSGSGGGGTFVTLVETNEPLLVAGGGGGQYDSSLASQANNVDSNASLSTSGNDGYCSAGGINGTGGSGASNGASGGAGFFGGGETGSYGTGGVSIAQGGAGGNHGSHAICVGGFGGGGGTHGNTAGGGGGGGYSGGGAGCHSGSSYGGGGGSFVDELATVTSIEISENDGHGFVLIEFVGPTAPPCELGCTTLQACNYNEDATNDDGTCDYCFCGPGTEYNAEAGQCLVVEGCTDFNDDGCTGTQDLLHLLSNFGNCDE